ncbi:uncharacterized protein LOC6043770 [Culex quinquefasciatus]|uniref:uncharacterized protein LOC6043770 n=1 Tax=Culex quinquefasciatus TaxID=7176 RepID=UPI0018E355CA|nr:uncharacterized protein LOC6043770 [Culex quinquefasciatus]
MKVAILGFCCLVVGILEVFPKPVRENPQKVAVEIESVLDEKRGNGTVYAHYLSDGTFVRQTTYTKIVDGAKIVVQEGEYSFIGIDKLRHKTTYIADENGYRAQASVSNMTGFIEDNIDPKVLGSLIG